MTVIADGWQHRLSFAVRFNDHFTGAPIADDLPVRLDESFVRPVRASDGGYRHSDGTYRFINIGNGVHRVRWLPALEDSFKGWVSWESDPVVVLPLPNPEELISRDLWPESSAEVPIGTTAIRGRLSGANVADQHVRIRHPALPSTRFTQSDDIGDFLFLLPQPLETTNNGRLLLDIEVENGARAVTGGDFVPSTSGASFLGSQFQVLPGKTSRVVFRIT